MGCQWRATRYANDSDFYCEIRRMSIRDIRLSNTHTHTHTHTHTDTYAHVSTFYRQIHDQMQIKGPQCMHDKSILKKIPYKEAINKRWLGLIFLSLSLPHESMHESSFNVPNLFYMMMCQHQSRWQSKWFWMHWRLVNKTHTHWKTNEFLWTTAATRHTEQIIIEQIKLEVDRRGIFSNVFP